MVLMSPNELRSHFAKPYPVITEAPSKAEFNAETAPVFHVSRPVPMKLLAPLNVLYICLICVGEGEIRIG